MEHFIDLNQGRLNNFEKKGVTQNAWTVLKGRTKEKFELKKIHTQYLTYIWTLQLQYTVWMIKS